MSALRTPYQILQVATDADPAVIEAAYKALIKKYHPDLLAHDAGAQHRAAAINEAWSTLKDPDLREACDREIRARKFAAPVIAPAPAPRRSGRGKRWWTGWLAALLIGGAQFVPWESILGDDGARSERFVETSEAPPAAPPASLIAKAEAAEAAYAATIRERPLTREEEDWARLPARASAATPVAASATAAGASAERAPRMRAPAANRASAAPSQRAAPRPRRERRAAAQKGEKDFLEREGYIY
jgi:curved DNA-binding protein CbpA